MRKNRMLNLRSRVREVVITVAMLATAVVVIAGSASGQTQTAAENSVIALRLTVSGRVASVKLPNKGCGSVTVEDQPTIRLYAETVGDDVILAGWEAAGDSDCLPPATAVRQKLVTGGAVDIPFGNVKLRVELVGLSIVLAAPSGQGPCSTCCVACQGVVFCACDVETLCGRCCCPDACQCPPPAAAHIRAAGSV
ncbi:MAG: hypothetical protein ACM3NQ_09235 [Bacteroidales bacterium]